MKFLILMKPKTAIVPHAPVTVLQAAKEWLDQRTMDGTFDCTYVFPTGGGIAIANAESPEFLLKLVYDFPQFGLMETEVLPLTDYRQAYAAFIEHRQRFQEHPQVYSAAAPEFNN